MLVPRHVLVVEKGGRSGLPSAHLVVAPGLMHHREIACNLEGGTHHPGIVSGLYSRWLLQCCYFPAWFWGAPWTTWHRPGQASWIHPPTINHYCKLSLCRAAQKPHMLPQGCNTQAREGLEGYSVSTSSGASPAEPAGQVSGSAVLLSYQQQKGESHLYMGVLSGVFCMSSDTWSPSYTPPTHTHTSWCAGCLTAHWCVLCRHQITSWDSEWSINGVAACRVLLTA